MEDLKFTNPDILKARNPFGLFGEFNESQILALAKVELELVPVESIQPTDAIGAKFNELRRISVASDGHCEMITNAMTWEDRNVGTISYFNYQGLDSQRTVVFQPQCMNLQGELYLIQPDEPFLLNEIILGKKRVKIDLTDESSPNITTLVPNMESWEEIVKYLHEAGHYQSLIASSVDELKFYNKSLVRFYAMQEVRGESKASSTDVALEREFTRLDMVEILKQEHAASRFAIQELERIKQNLNMPDSLHIELLKRLVRDYRSYCAWANIVLAYYS